jgi:hypothetical protein
MSFGSACRLMPCNGDMGVSYGKIVGYSQCNVDVILIISFCFSRDFRIDANEV